MQLPGTPGSRAGTLRSLRAFDKSKQRQQLAQTRPQLHGPFQKAGRCLWLFGGTFGFLALFCGLGSRFPFVASARAHPGRSARKQDPGLSVRRG